jgi:uncharacterized protein with LGFP repeats
MGWERSPLGYPLGKEKDHSEGRIQQFEHGSLLWNRQTNQVRRV